MRSPLNIRIAPDWREGNPYQRLLAESVEHAGGSVSFVSNYRRGLPLTRDWLAASPRPDVLHLHWLSNHLRFEDYARKWLYGQKLALDLRILANRGVGLVWTIHNAVSHEARFPVLERRINRRIAWCMDHYILHSESAAQEIAPVYRPKKGKVRVIPHGHYRSVYPLPMKKTRARDELRLSHARRVILFFGLLRPYKGLEALLEAWAQSQDAPEMEGVHLIIAGKALDNAYLEELNRTVSTLKRVRLDPGYVPDEKIPVYFGGADAMVLPFKQILTSGSLLLGLSYGVPVIAPDLSLVREILEQANGLTYPSDAPHGLAAALKHAATTDLEALEAATHSRADAFGWENIGRRTLEVYAEAAALGRKRRMPSATRSAAANPSRR